MPPRWDTETNNRARTVELDDWRNQDWVDEPMNDLIDGLPRIAEWKYSCFTHRWMAEKNNDLRDALYGTDANFWIVLNEFRERVREEFEKWLARGPNWNQ